jgi:ABC-type sugar transport system permease subunit
VRFDEETEMMKPEKAQELLGAGIVVLIACGFLYFGSRLRLGTAASMGPGYLPMLLAGSMLCFGAAIAVRAFFVDPEPVNWPSLRATGVVVVCPIIFGILVPAVGLAIATVATAVLARLARGYPWTREAVITPILLSVFCCVLFVVLLKLPIQIWP